MLWWQPFTASICRSSSALCALCRTMNIPSYPMLQGTKIKRKSGGALCRSRCHNAGAEAGLETAAFYEHALEDDLTELLPFFLLTELLPFTSLLGSIRCQQCHHRLRNRLGLGSGPGGHMSVDGHPSPKACCPDKLPSQVAHRHCL